MPIWGVARSLRRFHTRGCSIPLYTNRIFFSGIPARISRERTLAEIATYVPMRSSSWALAAASAWANQNKVKLCCYVPNWRRHGRGGGAVAARKMLKAQFDHKQLLVFLPDKISTSMNALLKGAEKKGIPVIRKSVPTAAVRRAGRPAAETCGPSPEAAGGAGPTGPHFTNLSDARNR